MDVRSGKGLVRSCRHYSPTEVGAKISAKGKRDSPEPPPTPHIPGSQESNQDQSEALAKNIKLYLNVSIPMAVEVRHRGSHATPCSGLLLWPSLFGKL